MGPEELAGPEGRLSPQAAAPEPAAWARALGVSVEAVELYLDSDVLDLHLDSFIWTRIFGYDLHRRHRGGLFGHRLYGQVDLPRVLEARMAGATWVVTTAPWRPARRRFPVLLRNLEHLRGILEAHPGVSVVRTASEYRQARARGLHGAFLGIQGGQALDGEPGAVERLPPGLVLRVTLVHFTPSRIGVSSAPGTRLGRRGLTRFGREFVRRLEARRILVDLAHIDRRGFFDAVEVHDPSRPLLVSHTGAAAVHPHWRNLDDAQLRAVADSGGTVGVMFQASFLGDPPLRGRCETVARHLLHIVRTVGEDHASLGSDWDGAILPPRDLRSPLELPRLVEHLLRAGLGERAIRKILGQNFLRVVEQARG